MARMIAKRREQGAGPAAFPLALAGEGEQVRIVLIHGGRMVQQKMLNMGLHLDDVIQVVHRQGQGAVLIAKAGHSYAFGGGMSHKIKVERVER
ncbi:FeoA family protein [Desulfogranum mediterraneum]|uniref:FeoA family protein n=1 Tax=Desulfogranum mediterraneum TaxID=160661 RepID=UPI00040FC838|nr:FeoA family protein [Desulfogranum mediterraneum]